MGRRSTHTPDQLRELIVASATDVIDEHGLVGLSAREIARRIGYSPGTIYNVFRDLDDLVFTIEARLLDRLAAQIANAPAYSDPQERLAAMASAYLAFCLENPRLWNLLMEHVPQSGGALPSEFQNRIDSVTREFERVVGEMVGRDNPAQIRRIASVLWAGIHGISTLATAHKPPGISEENAATLVDDLVRTYLRGLTEASASQDPKIKKRAAAK